MKLTTSALVGLVSLFTTSLSIAQAPDPEQGSNAPTPCIDSKCQEERDRLQGELNKCLAQHETDAQNFKDLEEQCKQRIEAAVKAAVDKQPPKPAPEKTEKPAVEKPLVDKPVVEKPVVEKPAVPQMHWNNVCGAGTTKVGDKCECYKLDPKKADADDEDYNPGVTFPSEGRVTGKDGATHVTITWMCAGTRKVDQAIINRLAPLEKWSKELGEWLNAHNISRAEYNDLVARVTSLEGRVPAENELESIRKQMEVIRLRLRHMPSFLLGIGMDATYRGSAAGWGWNPAELTFCAMSGTWRKFGVMGCASGALFNQDATGTIYEVSAAPGVFYDFGNNGDHRLAMSFVARQYERTEGSSRQVQGHEMGYMFGGQLRYLAQPWRHVIVSPFAEVGGGHATGVVDGYGFDVSGSQAVQVKVGLTIGAAF